VLKGVGVRPKARTPKTNVDIERDRPQTRTISGPAPRRDENGTICL